MAVLAVLFSPMFVDDAARFENPFNEYEKGDCTKENKGDVFWVGLVTFEGLREDVNHSVSNDSSAGKGVEHPNEYFKTALTHALLETYQKYGSQKSY